MSRCKCGIPERNKNWQLDGCEELRELKEKVQQLTADLTAAESRGREGGLREAAEKVSKLRTGIAIFPADLAHNTVVQMAHGAILSLISK